MTTQAHIPYEERLGRKCDFIVRYEVALDSRLGPDARVLQGQRTDFCYAEDYHSNGNLNVYMIWPEFLDQKDSVIDVQWQEVAPSGVAQMWIISPEASLRALHRSRIRPGTEGFMVVGHYKVAHVIVIDDKGLRSENA